MKVKDMVAGQAFTAWSWSLERVYLVLSVERAKGDVVRLRLLDLMTGESVVDMLDGRAEVDEADIGWCLL